MRDLCFTLSISLFVIALVLFGYILFSIWLFVPATLEGYRCELMIIAGCTMTAYGLIVLSEVKR